MKKQSQAARTSTRKSQIIQEAMRLFAQHGYRGTTIATVADAVGLTEPGLLHHFPSKEHLLIGVLEERDKIDRERFGGALRQQDTRILESLKMLVSHYENTPGLAQLFTVLVAESIDSEHPGNTYFVQRYRDFRLKLSEAFEDAQRNGEIRRDVETDLLASLTLAVMDGLQVQWLLEAEGLSMSKVINQFVHLLTDGHRRNEP